METDEDFRSTAPSAFPSQSAEAAAASWHPALRRNAEAVDEHDDDFFERYPGPTPKKNADAAAAAADATRVDELANPASPIRALNISGGQRVDLSYGGIMTRPLSGLYEEDDEEALMRDPEVPILSPERTAAEQELALEEHMPDEDSEESDSSSRPASSLDAQAREEEEPGEHYEHQGEITEMEAALEPSAAASLLQNEQPLPTTGLVSRTASSVMPPRQSAIALDEALATPLVANSTMPSLQRAFTTNFSDSPIEPAQIPSRSIPDEWPSVGDDKTFAELLDHEQPRVTERAMFESMAANEAARVAAPDATQSPAQVRNQILEATAAEEAQRFSAPDLDLLPEDEGELPEEDLAAAWGAALDDDDMLEDTPVGLDPSNFFGGDDDDGFLGDEPLAPAPMPMQHQQQQKAVQATQYRPANLQAAPSQPQQTIPSPQFFNPSGHGRAAATPSTGLFDVHNQVGASPQIPQQPQRPTSMQQAQSFSDKAKGGYQSPYDLPMEVVKPKKRAPQLPQQPTPLQPPAVPPVRSSSITSPTSPTLARPNMAASVSNMSPPPSRGSTSSGGVPLPATTTAKSTPKTSGSGFFEELPVTSKQRNRPSGAYTPQPAPGLPTPPPQVAPASPQRNLSQQQGYAASAQAPQQPNMYAGLRQPERMPLLPDQPSVPVQRQQPAAVRQASPPNTRYSPAPTATAAAQPPAATARYSPAPAAQPTQVKPRQASVPFNANPFAPRTSSPLAAYTDKPHPPLPTEQMPSRNLPPSSPPKVNGLQRSPPDSGIAARYSPADNRAIDPPQQFGPPLQRAALPVSSGIASASQAVQQPKGPVLPHRRQFSRQYSFTPPQDERALDPLQRWKGYPIFKWSDSGVVLSTFPKQTPFYSAGQGIPSVKITPGPISVQDATNFFPMDERNAKFPGPLQAKAKGRKKDVLAWMAGKIEDLERATQTSALDFSLPSELKKRTEEKLILWRIMRIFVEHDGVLDGNAKIEEEARALLLPNLAQMAQVAELQSPGSAVVERDAVDKHITLQLRQALLEGRREHAVWLAEEKRLWGHAMLIASTMGPDTWKQIVQAFVRNQVKSFGSDARGLAALYQVFAGNSEECVDELVPPSARAGFQMISMADGSVAGNPLEGLDQWRETLGLVTSNRTPNDAHSLIALGKMLAGYGRVEAAHTCYLFARGLVKHSGPDDADAHFVLLGANHQAKDENFGNDLDSILLTEIYEYATSLSGPTTTPPYIPHLQAFKLVHAHQLAAHGLKSKAQTYCDAITSAYTSTTRPSPYYHPNFTQAVAEMSAFLSQTPLDGKSGFLSRPALNKVSSSATSWFTKFVAGDDDQESSGSGPGGAGSESGPFGGVNGDSGSISRNVSGTDLYNPMSGGAPIPVPAQPFSPQAQSFAPASAPSRYTPGAPAGIIKQTPAAPYSGSGFPGAEPQRPSSSRYAPPPSAGSNLGVPGHDLVRKTSNYSLPNLSGSRRGSAQDNMSVGSYEPRPLLGDDSSPYSYSPQINSPPVHTPAVSSPLVLAQQPPAAQEAEDAFGAPDAIPAPLNVDEDGLDVETSGGYEPPSGGYEPPSYTYQPYEPDPESPDDARPKKTFGDDDDDAEVEVEKRAAALKKAQADREADELVRKAAEADSARDKEKAAQKKGWFGGWFAGNKEGSLTPGPIKAKLGEENSFYFDKDLGKWVNKKGGTEAAAAAAPTPPPPRGPASRAVSSAMGPPSGPPSRNISGAALASVDRPSTSGSGGAVPSGPPTRSATPASNPASEPGLAPPMLNGESLAPSAVPALRPTSSLSNASSIDDLLGGPPGPRKAGGTLKGKKKGRYVDVMAK